MSESNDNAALILDAISDLRERVETGFERIDDRVRTVETSITKIHTVGSVFGLALPALAFFGWSTVKTWLLTLMKS